jgi:hypothetical protein
MDKELRKGNLPKVTQQDVAGWEFYPGHPDTLWTEIP